MTLYLIYLVLKTREDMSRYEFAAISPSLTSRKFYYGEENYGYLLYGMTHVKRLKELFQKQRDPQAFRYVEKEISEREFHNLLQEMGTNHAWLTIMEVRRSYPYANPDSPYNAYLYEEDYQELDSKKEIKKIMKENKDSYKSTFMAINAYEYMELNDEIEIVGFMTSKLVPERPGVPESEQTAVLPRIEIFTKDLRDALEHLEYDNMYAMMYVGGSNDSDFYYMSDNVLDHYYEFMEYAGFNHWNLFLERFGNTLNEDTESWWQDES